MSRKSILLVILCAGLVLAAGILGSAANPSAAAPLAQATPTVSNLSIGDDYCLSCHGQPGQTTTLADGSTLDLYVNPQDHASSIHGQQGYACVQCHSDVGQYPHPEFVAANRRDATLKLNAVCQRCHASQDELSQNSVHAQAKSEGKVAAAVCTDCHTAHTVQAWVDNETGKTLPEARTRIPETCAKCHNAIYQDYLTSVHGSALTNENNPDVPTCIDCHGVHDIQDPTTAEFRLASPKICANCHTDPAIMTKYGISTNVLSTYVADFHGTTVAIFEKQSPDAETNKPVCYDCHGVHNIKRVDDPHYGLRMQENLLATCQKCHPNAQSNFPTAWLSHYDPSPDKYALVYYVNLFYKIFIPTVLGGMAILVALDFSRLMINKRRRRPSQIAKERPPTPPAPDTAPDTEQALQTEADAGAGAVAGAEVDAEANAAPEPEPALEPETETPSEIEQAFASLQDDEPERAEDTPAPAETPADDAPGSQDDPGEEVSHA